MKKYKKKIIAVLLAILSVISIGVNTYAHSGRTDSSGGHKDNKNKSGLGSYHYHCGGHPAHLHSNGVCPYSSSSKKNKSSSSASNKSTTPTSSISNEEITPTVPATIVVTDIKINENVTSMQESESKQLTVTITPDNANDKSIIWKSSDESIATVSTEGEVVAKKYGEVEITVTSSNEKTDTIKIEIKEKDNERSVLVNTVSNEQNNRTNNIKTSGKDDSNWLGGFLIFALLIGGGYFGYKKYKK